MRVRNLIHAVIKPGTPTQPEESTDRPRVYILPSKTRHAASAVPPAVEAIFQVPKAELPALAEAYVKWLEVSPTEETCKCEWVLHPDDVEVKAKECRECYQPLVAACHRKGDVDYHPARSRRLRLKDENPMCPLYTKAGRVTGFFEWLFLVELRRDDAASYS